MLAADEQADAPGRAVFGRQCSSAHSRGPTMKGIVRLAAAR